MSQAISHQSHSDFFSFERTLPYLRTLIDMLLVAGGLLLGVVPTRCLFLSPTNLGLAIFLAGCWLIFLAGTTLIISTARSNRLAHRQTAFFCVSIIMLFYAGVSVLVSCVLPNTEVMKIALLMTMGVCVWGCVCSGLISIEKRIVKKLNIAKAYDSNFGIAHTLQRVLYLPVGFLLSMEWIFWPICLILLATNNGEYLEAARSQDAIVPETIAQAGALCTIALWAILAKCSLAVLFWRLLKSFHTPGVDPAQVMKKRWEGRLANIYMLFLSIGVVGIITLTITYNATTFGLESAPWILSAMICCLVFGCWKLQRVTTNAKSVMVD